MGGLLGYQIGRHIYKTRHNPSLDDDLKIVAEQTSVPRPGNIGSIYVPLDSWIYPAMESLIGSRLHQHRRSSACGRGRECRAPAC